MLAWLLRPHALAPADFTESLAILPVANQTGDPQLDYVSDGITESLINNMSQFRHLKVLARTTAFRYKGRNVDAQSAGRELNVRRVLTGTLVRRAESLNVQVDLVNVADGSEVWGHRYNEAASNLVGLPETISRNISDSLQLRLNVTEQKQLSKRHTENPEAYRLYLLGRHYWNRRDWNDQGATEKAIAYFQQAIEKDPLYALAYVGLAEAYSTFSVNGDVSQREADLKAKAAARKALEIDENVAEAYVALASIEADQWNWPEADKAFRRALELNPGNATAHHWYAEYLEKTGRVKEALVEMRRGYELDPLSPTMLLVLGTLLYDDHQYAPAVEQLRKVLALNPDSGMAYVHIAVIRLIQKSFPEAMVELDHADSRMPGAPILMALRGYVYAQTGKRQAALDIIPKLRDSSTSRHGTALDLPVLYLGLGDKDRAFEALNRSVDERAPLIDLLKVDPFFEPLHSDPRYARLLRRMNLTP